MARVEHRSGKMDWATPQALFDAYDAVHHFDLDAAAQWHNTKCLKYLGPAGEVFAQIANTPARGDHPQCVGVNALEIMRWPGQRIWLNPPYGRGIGRWYRKATEHALDGKLVVMLVPARTDTKYWHAGVWNAARAEPHFWVRRIDFLPGRVKFVGATNGAPFPSAVITFGLPPNEVREV